MPVSEGVQVRVAYKAYAATSLSANSELVPATDPASSGGQELRRVASTLALVKDTYRANEIRSDRQIFDMRHGTRRVTGSISGELSPGTWKDMIQAAFRGTAEAAIPLSNTDFTSVAATNSTSVFTFASGDPVALGLRLGHILNFTNLSEVGNNSTNFVITGFGGTSNRTVTVYPAPTDMTADTTFNVTTVGKRNYVPSSSFVSRLFAFEHFRSDIDVTHLFTECRVAGLNLNLPASGIATIEVPVMGRGMTAFSGASSPFFTSPTAVTTTGELAAVNGLLQVAGTTVGVVTGLQLGLNLNPSSDAVVGQNFVPEIFLGRADVSGTISAQFQDGTLLSDFINETEVSVLVYLSADTTPAAKAMTIYLPRIKFTGGNAAAQGEGAQTLSLPFQALKYGGSTAGVENTTIQIVDTDG